MRQWLWVIVMGGALLLAIPAGCGNDDDTVAKPQSDGGTGGYDAGGYDTGTAGSPGGWPSTGGTGGTGGTSGGDGGQAGAGGTQSAGAGAQTGGVAGSGGSICEGHGGSGGPCAFPQGVPESDYPCSATSYQDTDPTVDADVNAVMASLSGCSPGSDCTITVVPGTNFDEICQNWFAAVTQALREQGYCAGQHEVGHTDEIAVSNTGCTGKWYGYHICNYGGGKVVWNPGARRGWWMILPSHCPP